MTLELLVKVGGSVGFLLSALYEIITIKWRGKDLKKWVFVALSLLIGGGLAIAQQEVLLPNMSWETTPDILESIMGILSYGLAILGSATAWFKTNITKKI